MKKRVVFLAGIIGLVLVLLVVLLYPRSRQQETGRGLHSLVLHGNVDIRQISLAFDGSGRITRLLVEEGDQVRTGQLLGELDTRTLALEAAQAKALMEVQEQTLLRLRNGSRPEEIEQARSRLLAARVELGRAGQDQRRLQEIAATTQGKGVSSQDLDHAGRQVESAQARVAELQAALKLAEQGPRHEEVAGAAAQLQAQKARLAILQHQIGLGVLHAPADAVVRTRLLEPGDMATPQRSVFALALTHPKWVRVWVNEADLGRIRPGMPAEIFTDTAPDHPVTGHIGYISQVAEFTPKAVQTEELRTSLVYEVRVLTDDRNDALRLGQPATVRLGSREAS